MGILVVSKVFGGFFVSSETVSYHDGSTGRKIAHMEYSRTLYRNSQETFFNNDGNILVKKNVKIVDKFIENSEFIQEF